MGIQTYDGDEVIATIAKGIKTQWDVQVSITGKGDKSLAIHETAIRIADEMKKKYKLFDWRKFLTDCGIEGMDEIGKGRR